MFQDPKLTMEITISPSKFQGLPWESWTNSLGRTSPIADKPPENKPVDKNKGFVMKLPKEDMKIFGLCPERDKFSVVVCETCGSCVKPQALLHHFETRHMNKEVPPAQPSVEVALTEKAKVVKSLLKNPTKVKKNKTLTKDSSKGREGVVNPPSLPVSLTLETTTIQEPGTTKGEGLHPVVTLISVSGAPAVPAATLPPVLPKAPRRPPRKHAPIKEREYDPDKHCGVVTAENLKPCTWSLTCKSHPMSLRRAVPGRSKPFDQLLADHRQAKEALMKRKKNPEQSPTVVPTPPVSRVNPTPMYSQSLPKPAVVEKYHAVDPTVTLAQRLPELKLDVTNNNKQLYLSCIPHTLVSNVGDKSAPAQPPPANPAQTEVVASMVNHPRPLGVTSLFTNHKIGGLVYTNRRMQIARHGLETCLQRAGNGLYLTLHGRDTYHQHSSLSNVLNHVSSRADLQKKRNKTDKSKSNKKGGLSKNSSVVDVQMNNYKSILSRQYPNTQNRITVPKTADAKFHIPNILSNALKRPTETSVSKTQNKKLKKKNSPVVNSVLSNHSKNGLSASKPSMPYVRVAISNGKVESESKTLGLCETPKYTSSNKILNEADIRKIGLRFEIFD